jgi:hypothetical protein
MGTDTRAQGLLVGAALAIVVHRRPDLAGRWTTPVAVAGGAFLVAVCLWLPGTDPRLYRGGHLAVAVAAAAVVAACLRSDGPVRAVLAARPLQAVGRVSYGAYLWHWPLFVWLTPDRTGLEPWPLLAVRCAATAAAAALSWHVVERPVLDGRPLPRPHLAVPAAVTAALVVVVGATALDPAAHPGAGGATAAAAVPSRPIGFTAASVAPPVTLPGVLDTAPVPLDRAGDPVVTVVGDSTGLSLGWAVEPVEGVEVFDGASLGCGLDPADMIIGDTVRHEAGHPVPCPDALDLWRWWVVDTQPDVVVLAVGAWEVYDRRLPDGSRMDVGTAEWAAWVDAGLERVLTALAADAPQARIAVTEVPCYEERNLGLGGPASARNDPARQAAVNEVIDAVVARHPARLVVLPWTPWLCDTDDYARGDGVHLEPPAAHALWAGPLGAWVRDLVSTSRQ